VKYPWKLIVKHDKLGICQNYGSFSIVLIFLVSVLFVNAAFAKAPLLTAKELATPPPRIIRTCCSFGYELGVAGIPFIKKTDITSIGELGAHHYMGSSDEGNGNIYTSRGGFIDIGHLRDNADWTAYLYLQMLSVQPGEDEVEINLGHEGGAKTLVLKLPKEFDSIPIYQLAGKIAFDLSLWHEISTWYGASYIPLIPERYSSFSPEDLYSNLLGINLGIRALKSNLSYDEAMTQLISATLDSLEAVSTIEETYLAMEKVENIWWTSKKKLPSKKILMMRYLDASNDLSPWLVPDVMGHSNPYILHRPGEKLDYLYELKIKLNNKFPMKTWLISPEDGTINQKDFDVLLSFIEQDIDDLNAKIALQYQKHRKKSSKEKI